MTDRAKKISELNAHSNAPANNLLVIVHQPGLANAETMKITLSNLFANVASNVNITGSTVRITGTSAPANSSSTGVAGQIAFDSGYVYYCVANNTWKRATLSTW